MSVQRLGDEFQMGVIELHVAQGESNERDVSLAIEEVEVEGDLRLEETGLDTIVQEDGPIPGAVKKRVLQSASWRFAEPGEKCFCHEALLHP